MRKHVSHSARGTPPTKFGTSTKRRLARYPNIHLGPQLADSELFKLCCHILSGRKPPAQGQSREHGLCFTKMKDLPRAVNPGPGWYPPDLEPNTKQAGEHNCKLGVLRGAQAAHEPKIRAEQKAALPGLMERGEVSITWKTSRQGYLTIRIRHKGHWIRYFFHSEEFRGSQTYKAFVEVDCCTLDQLLVRARVGVCMCGVFLCVF